MVSVSNVNWKTYQSLLTIGWSVWELAIPMCKFLNKIDHSKSHLIWSTGWFFVLPSAISLMCSLITNKVQSYTKEHIPRLLHKQRISEDYIGFPPKVWFFLAASVSILKKKCCILCKIKGLINATT